ncbi:MAG: bifunctional DNA primase/polymerase [Planctomycetales bacterium]|nr:bifunctional DNA primase/polymerase [Planctomycetales bacterium]
MPEHAQPDVRSQVAEYRQRGWYCVPLRPRSKSPARRDWTSLRLQPDVFPENCNVGIILGEPSGWLVDVDLDCPEAIELAESYLPPTPAITGRPSSPKSHRWYIASGATTQKHSDPNDGSMVVELRSTGGQTVVGPSIHPDGEPYDVLDAQPAQVPAPMLAACVKALADAVTFKRGVPAPIKQPPTGSQPPIDNDIEARAIAYLAAMPPAISGSGGHSQTYAAATALVHGFGLDTDRALAILAAEYNPRCSPPWSDRELQHKINQAATKPHDRPYGWLRDEGPIELVSETVDLSGFMAKPSTKVIQIDSDPPKPMPTDPGVLPESLLRCPGFIAEVMDHCLETAPYPNPVMAFCGALSLQAVLAGRRVRDPGDNRTNLYLLGLAHSAAGKDWPRKLNMQILQQVGMADCVGERFASGEGIQDSLFLTESMLFQTDEIDGLLQSINKSRDARYEQIMSTLLTMYSSANSVYPMRRKAGKEAAGVINQPNLVIFGTAIPNHYYAALSERMLTNGLFARMLIFECGRRGKGQEPKIREIPDSIRETADWWENFRPGAGNLVDWNPTPAIVPHDDDARRLLCDARVNAETQYDAAEAENDSVGTTVWGRVSEQTRKLALIHAVSRNCRDPIIDAESARWAIEVVEHQTRRMLFMAASHVAENPFHGECLRLLEKLRKAPERTLPHSVLLKRMKMEAKVFHQLIDTLVQQGDLSIISAETAGRPQRGYRMTDQAVAKDEGEEAG